MALDFAKLKSLSVDELEALSEEHSIRASRIMHRAQLTADSADRRNYNLRANSELRTAEQIIRLAMRKASEGR